MPRPTIAVALICFANAASAQEAPRAQPMPAAAAARPAGDKVVCRHEVPIGSNFMRRTCHTAAQWAEFDGTAHQQVDQLNATVGHVGFGSSNQGALP